MTNKYKCLICGRRSASKENTIIKFCAGCGELMQLDFTDDKTIKIVKGGIK